VFDANDEFKAWFKETQLELDYNLKERRK